MVVDQSQNVDAFVQLIRWSTRRRGRVRVSESCVGGNSQTMKRSSDGIDGSFSLEQLQPAGLQCRSYPSSGAPKPHRTVAPCLIFAPIVSTPMVSGSGTRASNAVK